MKHAGILCVLSLFCQTHALDADAITPHTISESAMKEVARFVQQAPRQTPAPAGNGADTARHALRTDPVRPWAVRHPVLVGLVAGAALGTVVDAAGCGGTCGFYTAGAMIGAFGGLVASISRRSALKYDASTHTDPSALRHVVDTLGVKDSIYVEAVGHPAMTGRITGIGDDRFAVLPKGASAPLEIPYADVRVARGKRVGIGEKVGLAGGALISAATAASLAAAQ